MAVVGVPGWIGYSAVQETGQNYMSEAGRVLLNRAPPFYMSEFAGKSKSFFMTIGAHDWETPLAGRAYDRGCGPSNYGQTWIGNIEANTVWGGVTQFMATRSRVSTTGGPVMNATPAYNILCTMNGVDFWFNYQFIEGWGGFHAAADPNGFFDFMNARIGWRIECIPRN